MFETRPTPSFLLTVQHNGNTRKLYSRIQGILVKVNCVFLVGEMSLAFLIILSRAVDSKSLMSMARSGPSCAQPHSYFRGFTSNTKLWEPWSPECTCATLSKMQRFNIGSCKLTIWYTIKLTNLKFENQKEEREKNIQKILEKLMAKNFQHLFQNIDTYNKGLPRWH